MSAMIAETRSWVIGPYRIQQRPHPDNPAWACYIVFRGAEVVGKSFSMPDLGCCQWLEQRSTYGKSEAKPNYQERVSARWRRRLRAKPAT